MLLHPLLATFVLLPAPQEAPLSGDFASAWQEVRASFERQCVEHGVVGASLQFVKGDAELGFVAHGFADRAQNRRVDRDTIFHWASCTKTLTGIAILQLRDHGGLALERPAVELLPELRTVHSPFGPIERVTLVHLLTHSAGLRAGTWPWGGEPWHPFEPTEWSQLVAMMPYTRLEFAPGAKYSYSNPGIALLGRIVEVASGEPYEAYVEKNVLRPLGMQRSYFDKTPYHLQRYRAHSYEGDGAAAEDLGADFDTGITVSNSGLNAPLPDLAKYLAFLLGAVPAESDAAGVLARSSLESMWEPRLATEGSGKEHVGLVFFVQECGGTRFATHTGNQRGFHSFLYVHPASQTGAVGAFNTSSAEPLVASIRTLCMERLSMPMMRRG